MRPALPIIGLGLVLGLAIWAYQQNYATQDTLRRVDELNHEIAFQRERLAILRAEWAYLNRPDRLRDLADMNFATLRLLPMTHASFGSVAKIPYPEVFEAVAPARTAAQVNQ